MDNVAIAQTLFQALARGDDDGVRALCAPAFELRQNGGPVMDLAALLRFNQRVHAVVRDFRYEAVVCAATATGFVEEHAVRGLLPDGSELALAACVVGAVTDGKVTIVREYVDTAAAGPMLALLTAGRALATST
jgi:ketosteroid isomerase-like protein